MKKILILLPTTALIFSLFAGSPVLADNDSFASPNNKENAVSTNKFKKPERRRERKEGIRKERGKRRENRRENRKERRENRRGRIKDRRERRSEKLKARREKRRERLENRRERIKERREKRREKRRERRQEFRKKLEEIRDKRRKARIERHDKRLARINERWTTHFFNVLDRLEEILTKLEERGADTSSAQTAIDSAKSAVEEQAAKEYIINITDESTVRNDAKATNRQLRQDLHSARAVIKQARQSVRDAFKSLRESAVEIETQTP